MRGLYKWSQSQPFHISVGVLLTNQKGEVCVHHFQLADEGERFQVGMGSAQEYYLLMRESVEDGETLEAAAVRGVREEFGATGTMRRYLGSIQSTFEFGGTVVEKTTLYFHMECLTFDGNLRVLDGENKSKIEWLDPHHLVEHMERLGALMERTDRNEAKILKAYLKLSAL